MEDTRAPIGVVVVNYASSALIETNLAAGFAGPERPGVRVVVVDNLSSPAERSAIRTLTARRGWTLVEMPGNLGFGSGVNAGVQRADQLGCESFLLLNPDAIVTPDTVEALRVACRADRSAVVAPVLADPAGHIYSAGSTLDLVDGRVRGLRAAIAHPNPRARPVTWVTAACLALHRDLWHRSGGFDESYFMYWEDVDFNVRAVRAGGRIALREDLVALHDQGGTQGPRRGRAKSRLYYYYNCRNRLLFGVRHLGRRELARWLVSTPRVCWETLLRGGRRQLVSEPGLAWSAASGGLAGMWLATRRLLRLTWPR